MIRTYKNGVEICIVTHRDKMHNAYLERRLRTDIKNYCEFIKSNPNSTAKQRQFYFNKVVSHVSYNTQMVEYVESGMENTHWVELLTTVIELMEAELATLDMSDYYERSLIAHPYQWVKGNIHKSLDRCKSQMKTTQRYLRDVLRETFLYGCATQNSGSTVLPLIGARYAYGPIRKHIAEYVGIISV